MKTAHQPGHPPELAPLLDIDQRKILLIHSDTTDNGGLALLILWGRNWHSGDNVDLFDRNGLRTPMQWDALAERWFSDADHKLYAPVIKDEVYGFKRVNVAAGKLTQIHCLTVCAAMIRVRKRALFGRGLCLEGFQF